MNIQILKGPKSDKQYQDINFFRRGGMGEIYSSLDIESGLKKAIKIVPIGNDEEFELLNSEFEISESLKHPNIVETEYFGEFQQCGVRYIYSVMSFFENGSLRDLLAKQTSHLEIKTVIRYFIELAEGLEAAHQKVIHRDLKPENILIGNNSELKLCDFGLAKLIDVKTRTRTFKGSGTLPYMAPECWVFDSNTTSMDIYSLGIIFYEILTMKLPFEGRNESEFRDKHLYEALPNLSNSRLDIPIRLIEVINKMTNKRQNERYSNVKEIVKILNDITYSTEHNNDADIDSLLKKANYKITATQQAELKRNQEQELIDNELKFIDFSKKTIYQNFTQRIHVLNQSLEREKIRINGNQNNFTVSFLNKSFSTSYFSNADIPNMLKSRKEAIIQQQQRQYGMVLQSPPATYIEKDNVLLIGKVILYNGRYGQESWGYNLILRRANQQDIYGEWWVAWFNDSAFSNKSNEHYAIDIPDFYQEYEFGRGRVMHIRTMELSTFESKIIDSLIGKILE